MCPCNDHDAKPVSNSLIVLPHSKASDTQNKSFVQKWDWAEEFPSAYPTRSLGLFVSTDSGLLMDPNTKRTVSLP